LRTTVIAPAGRLLAGGRGDDDRCRWDGGAAGVVAGGVADGSGAGVETGGAFVVVGGVAGGAVDPDPVVDDVQAAARPTARRSVSRRARGTRPP
jgi:hypothetical protein